MLCHTQPTVGRRLPVESLAVQDARCEDMPATSSHSGDTRPVPVVVVEGSLNALGVLRSLGPSGVPVYLLDTTTRRAARWSRYCRFVRVAAISGPPLLDALEELAHKLRCRPVLILTGDEGVNCISENRHRIEPLYRISLPSVATVRALADKALFHQLAQQEGFPVPRSVCLSSDADLGQIDALTPPLVVKPADKTLVLQGAVERGIRASTSAEGRRAAAHMLVKARSVVVQEWIQGPDTDLFFALFTCDAQGEPRGIFFGRKLVCSPPDIGSTAVSVAAAQDMAQLADTTARFLARVSYRGLGSLEFKYDARQGQFLIIEPTVGRTDWQEELATLCGINLPLLTYCSELELPLPHAPPPLRAVAWRQSPGFRSSLTHGMRVVDGFFRWSDPVPGLYQYLFEDLLLRAYRKAAHTASGLTDLGRGHA
jgi:D-aspartate ligase